MDIKKIMEIRKIGKEKLLLLGLAGIMLIGASYFESVKENKSSEEITEVTRNIDENYQNEMERKVEHLIENIKDISDVSAIISLKSKGEKVLKEDSENSSSDRKDGANNEKSNSVKKTTVILQQDGKENPYIIKEFYPEIEGIAVAAKGIERSGRKEDIINMLAALFDVPVHKITILEIK